MFDVAPFAQGLALGLGLFACPGPKDLVILQQALLRRPAAELWTAGVGSDALLIVLGMTGVSIALHQAPALQRAAMWAGVALMVWHGTLAAWRVVLGSRLQEVHAAGSGSRAALWLTSLVNPVAWLDTVLVIGTTGALLPASVQPSFGVGAVAASALWFSALIGGARYAARWMTQPRVRRGLDGFVAATMLGLAGVIGFGLL